MSVPRGGWWVGGVVCAVGGLIAAACTADGLASAPPTGEESGVCHDTCPTAWNGICEDGALGATAATCLYGSDCTDCGGARPQQQAPPPTTLCDNTCLTAMNMVCDDGGPGAVGVTCAYGTDCYDCGERQQAGTLPPTGGTGGTGGVAPLGGTGGLAPLGGTGGVAPLGGTGGGVTPSGGGTSTAAPGNSGIIPDDGGNFAKDWNVSGVVGAWYVFADAGGSTIVPAYSDLSGFGDFGSQNGEFCFSGDVPPEAGTVWGAGVGLDVCSVPTSGDLSWLPPELQGAPAKSSAANCPTLLTAVNSVSFTISGSWSEMRLGFKASDAQEIAPFVTIAPSATPTPMTVQVITAMIPSTWDVPGAGVPATPDIVSMQWQIAAQVGSATTFNFCISDVTVN